MSECKPLPCSSAWPPAAMTPAAATAFAATAASAAALRGWQTLPDTSSIRALSPRSLS